ncbi:hypothetical protein B5F39_08615 [Cloacibacillus sp. An23]|nr:hypothetical protein B5F39_08615 [Cloacibacillus sp. An23]
MGFFGNKKDKGCGCGGEASRGADAACSGAPVKVLGAGCARCRELDAAVRSVLEELGSAAVVEHVTDFPSIAAYGVMSTPALVINGKVAVCGRVPDRSELKKILADLSA